MTTEFPPELFIRERIFQPIVNRTQVDPQIAKWSCFRFFAIGMILSYGSICATTMMDGTTGTSRWWAPVVLLLMLAGTIWQIWSQVRHPGFTTLDVSSSMLRCMWAFAGILAFTMAITSLIQGDGSTFQTVIIFGMAASWTAGVSAAFVNVCRKPPPRKPDVARRLAFAGR
jgi:hypothetical protein